MNGHHILCNGVSTSDVKTCKWCGGPDGLLAQYPIEDYSPEELAEHYFPNAISRSRQLSKDNQQN